MAIPPRGGELGSRGVARPTGQLLNGAIKSVSAPSWSTLGPELVEAVQVSVVDGHLGDLSMMDLEVHHRDLIQAQVAAACRLSLEDHDPLGLIDDVQDLDGEAATATGLELSEKPEHGVRPLIIPRKGASPRFMPDNGVTQHDPQEVGVPDLEVLVEPTD